MLIPDWASCWDTTLLLGPAGDCWRRLSTAGARLTKLRKQKSDHSGVIIIHIVGLVLILWQQGVLIPDWASCWDTTLLLGPAEDCWRRLSTAGARLTKLR